MMNETNIKRPSLTCNQMIVHLYLQYISVLIKCLPHSKWGAYLDFNTNLWYTLCADQFYTLWNTSTIHHLLSSTLFSDNSIKRCRSILTMTINTMNTECIIHELTKNSELLFYKFEASKEPFYSNIYI